MMIYINSIWRGEYDNVNYIQVQYFISVIVHMIRCNACGN